MTALCLFALPAHGANQTEPLWGTWKLSVSNDPTYTAIMIIDRAGRVIWEDRWDPNYRRARGLKPVGSGQTKSFGYIKTISGNEFDVITTNREGVDRIHCATLSAESIRCDKGVTTGTRIGPGPESLMPEPR